MSTVAAKPGPKPRSYGARALQFSGDEQRPTALSLFSGIGGMDLGFEAAGFRLVGAVEIDPVARQTMAANRPDWKLLTPCDAITFARRVHPRDLGLEVGELGVIMGGPPCQPFSKAAQWTSTGRQGMQDFRAGTLGALLKIVDRFLPHAILLENVPGFLAGPANAASFIQQGLRRINSKHGTAYSLHARVVNAADYGVPQIRERVMAVAMRHGGDFVWPLPTCTDPITAWDALHNIRTHNPPLASGRWAELLPSIPEGHNYQWFTTKGGGPPLFGYRTRYWTFLLKLSKHKPAWTLTAQAGPANGPFHWDNRPLSTAERLRLQSFPEGWMVLGSFSGARRQIGNATPPLLSEVFARHIAHQVFGITSACSSKYVFSIPRTTRVPRAKTPRGIPQKYKHLIGRHNDHPGAGRGPSPRVLSTSYGK